ncbi:Pyrroline-5-carboxylate reductase [Planctomycetes bacterium Pan216]|uniref:Pyrroline-5-carboxylate reductase n=1 Tax=Kolteria novifilia TaxID=2527975 RepID=A0A518BBW9_9BACT|nr:Pyrroline-5-carboxylate reductase [Planctomycetes bacterium Pan216]
MKHVVGFLGAGQMAQALARGFLAKDLVGVDQLLAGDPSPASRSAFTDATGARAIDDNLEVVREAEILVLAVKPQYLASAVESVRSVITENHLVLSIAAGVPLARLEELLGNDRRIVRIMPNTACLVGASASGYCLNATASDEDAATVGQLLESVGVAFRLPESLLDAVTGLSGSGPAYVYLLIEALADGGVRMGLPRDVALSLAAQTVRGAATMVQETGTHPGQLKDAVASPGGTTIEGLATLEAHGFRSALIEAVTAATERSRELANR